MKPIHSITNVLVGSLVGGLLGLAIAYLIQASLVGEATVVHPLDATSRQLTVKNIYLAGAIAGAVIGSVAGATVSIVQAITMRRLSQERQGF